MGLVGGADEPVVVAALVGLLMLMFSATVSIVFSTEGSTVAIGRSSPGSSAC